MSKNIKNLSTLTALTLAISPAYGEKTPDTHSNAGVDTSVSAPALPSDSSTASESVRIHARDIDVEGPDLVVIRSPGLAYGVTFHPQEALHMLTAVSPIDLDDVTIDENGRVVIRDAGFAAKLQHRMGGSGTSDRHDIEVIESNIGCNCAC